MNDEVSQGDVTPPAEASQSGSQTADPGGGQADSSPHALIWVPSLQAPTENNSLAALSRRFAIALNRVADTAAATFRMADEIEEQELPGKIKVRKSTIVRQDGAKQRPMVDLYEIDYLETLLRPHEKANLFVRWWQVTWIAISGAFRAVRFFRVKAKSSAEKLQMLTVFLLLLLMAAYAWLLAAAIVVVVDEQLDGQPIASTWNETTQKVSAWGREWDDKLGSYLKKEQADSEAPKKEPSASKAPQSKSEEKVDAKPVPDQPSPEEKPEAPEPPKENAGESEQGLLLLLLAILGLRSFSSVRDFIEGAGARYASAIPYVQVGIQRATLVGRLSQVLEHIEEREQPYKDVSLMAYSFGTFIALDALFPHGRPPDKRFKRIASLVTIGCPYDLTRAFWPSYAGVRQADDVAPERWVNVYSPLDVMGSNFRDDHLVDEATVVVARRPHSDAEIKPENIAFRTGQAEEERLRFVDAVTFLGVRSHKSYWSDIEEGERTCLYEVVTAMYAGEDVLA